MKLNEENKSVLKQKIIDFYEGEMDEELGEIRAEMILDFFINDLSKEIYNKGVEDARDWYRSKFDELNIDSDSLLL